MFDALHSEDRWFESDAAYSVNALSAVIVAMADEFVSSLIFIEDVL